MPDEWKRVQTSSGEAEMRKTHVDEEGKTHYEFRVIGDEPGRTHTTHREIKKRKDEIKEEEKEELERYKEIHGIEETESGQIKGEGFVVHPSYGTPEERARFIRSQTTKEYPSRSVGEYQLSLTRVINSPFATQEQKDKARFAFQQIGRAKQQGYEFPVTYDIETGERQWEVAKPFHRPDAIREQELREEEQYQKYKGEYIQKLSENVWLAAPKIWEGGLTRHDPSFLTSFGEFLFSVPWKKYGTFVADFQERTFAAYDTHVRSQYEIHKAREKEGEWGYVKKVVEPGTPLFTAVSTIGIAFGIGGVMGAVARVSQTVAKAAQITTGGYFLGRGAAEVQSIATRGVPIKWGGALGLVPQGLQQAQPMTGAERFSSLAMMGATVPLAVVGYKAGMTAGYKLMSKVYTPKYIDLTNRAYPKLKPVGRDESGYYFKGVYDYDATRFRVITTKHLFKGTHLFKAGRFKGKFPVEGKLYGKDVTRIGAGGLQNIKAGEMLYTVGKGTLYKQVFGVWFSQKYPGGFEYLSKGTRPVKVQTGKEFGIDIQPYEYQTQLGKLFIEKPITTLTLTPKQMSTVIFKPFVESKFFPGESKNILKGISVETKSLAQSWELPVEKSVMKLPKLKDIEVKFFEQGKTIKEYPFKPTDAYGFTHKLKPEVWVRKPTKEPPVVDMFGREFKDETSAIIRHELTHRTFPARYTPEEEFIVQATSQKKISWWWTKPESIGEYKRYKDFFNLTDKEILQRQKATFPVVNKAVKNYLKTGSLGLKEQVGFEEYGLTPFRQISKTVTAKGIFYGKASGITAVLKETKPVTTMKQPETAYFKSTDATTMTKGIPQHQQELLTIKEPLKEIKLPPFSFQLGLLWKEMPLGYIGAKLPDVASMSRTEQEYIQGKKQRDLERITQIQLQPTKTELKTFSGIIQGIDFENKSLQGQVQLQKVLQRIETELLQTTTTPPPPVVPIPPPPPIITTGEDILNKVMPGWNPNQAYEVMLKPRTYVKGKRIRKDEYNIKANKKPLSYNDAMSLGSHIIDSNEKASFILKPVEGKPRKLSKRIPSFFSHSHEFFTNKKGQVVEKATSRIDSPGEIEAITMRGIASRKRKSSSDRDLDRVNKMVDSTVKRFLKKAGGF